MDDFYRKIPGNPGTIVWKFRMWLSDSPDGRAQHIWWGLRLVMALDVGYAADPRISRCTALIPSYPSFSANTAVRQ
ncbi:Uncharacterised protein [Mycobacteroides abscessus subsp. bolletii]|nr:Uncharacterised protein [Mycobacteroides abscessus subsp. bolletii]SLF57881.1 Uncharacterised protein [Mycobacteroides abscessus subsp. bolletii]